MAEREVRAEIHGPFQLDERLVLAAAQPQGPAHGPVRGRIVIVDQKALAGGLVGELAFLFAVSPALKGVLPMGEGQAGMGAGKGRIEPHGHPEEMLGELVLLPW